MKNFLLSSVFFCFISCATYSDGFLISEKQIEAFTPEFLINSTENSFRMSIDAYGNHFSGIVVCKKLKQDHRRFAFLNEFGGKMLDFELENQEFKLNHAVEGLDKKLILNMLQKDFGLIFLEDIKVEQVFESEEFLILKSNLKKDPVYLYLKNDTLTKTVMTGRKKEKIQLDYRYGEKEFPDVEISHKNVKIKIYLHLLDN